MATRAPKAAAAMCVLEIDYMSYAMPLAAGLRVVELMKDAQLVEPGYSEGGQRYYKKDEPWKISLEIIRERQVLPGPRPGFESDES